MPSFEALVSLQSSPSVQLGICDRPYSSVCWKMRYGRCEKTITACKFSVNLIKEWLWEVIPELLCLRYEPSDSEGLFFWKS